MDATPIMIEQSGTDYSVFREFTAIEIVGTVLPVLLLIIVSTILFSWPPTVLAWFSCGVGGLILVIWTGRAPTISVTVLDWPRPESGADIVINAIAYNGVLVLGTVIAEIVWQVSTTVLLAALVGVFLPFWFLKHIQFIAFMDSG
jgi:hypothetical protein